MRFHDPKASTSRKKPRSNSFLLMSRKSRKKRRTSTESWTSQEEVPKNDVQDEEIMPTDVRPLDHEGTGGKKAQGGMEKDEDQHRCRQNHGCEHDVFSWEFSGIGDVEDQEDGSCTTSIVGPSTSTSTTSSSTPTPLVTSSGGGSSRGRSTGSRSASRAPIRSIDSAFKRTPSDSGCHLLEEKGSIDGTLTAGCIDRVLDELGQYVQFGDEEVCIFDVGSGKGKSVAGLSAGLNVKTIGVEVIKLRYEQSIHFLEEPELRQLNLPCCVCYGDMMDISRFPEGITILFMFNVGFPLGLMRHVARCFNANQSIEYVFLCKAHHTQKMDDYGFNVESEALSTIELVMEGSNQHHTAMLYRRQDPAIWQDLRHTSHRSKTTVVDYSLEKAMQAVDSGPPAIHQLHREGLETLLNSRNTSRRQADSRDIRLMKSKEFELSDNAEYNHRMIPAFLEAAPKHIAKAFEQCLPNTSTEELKKICVETLGRSSMHKDALNMLAERAICGEDVTGACCSPAQRLQQLLSQALDEVAKAHHTAPHPDQFLFGIHPLLTVSVAQKCINDSIPMSLLKNAQSLFENNGNQKAARAVLGMVALLTTGGDKKKRPINTCDLPLLMQCHDDGSDPCDILMLLKRWGLVDVLGPSNKAGDGELVQSRLSRVDVLSFLDIQEDKPWEEAYTKLLGFRSRVVFDRYVAFADLRLDLA